MKTETFMELIRNGETEKIEFKSQVSKDIGEQRILVKRSVLFKTQMVDTFLLA